MELNFLQIRTVNNVYKITHVYIYIYIYNGIKSVTNMDRKHVGYIIYVDLHMIMEGLYIYIYIYNLLSIFVTDLIICIYNEGLL
jgi:hypothetical protein